MINWSNILFSFSFLSNWSWYFSRVQVASWFNWVREANRAFFYNCLVKGQLLWFWCSSPCSKVSFSSLFFKLDTNMRQFKFNLLFAVIDFEARETFLFLFFLLREDLNLLKLVGHQKFISNFALERLRKNI